MISVGSSVRLGDDADMVLDFADAWWSWKVVS